MKIALGIEYDGTSYHGWQSQAGLNTVQNQLEIALSKIADHPIEVVCAGRTDAGVHGTGQVVHFETSAERLEKAWIFGANTHLPSNISVQWAKKVNNDFHARYSALNRRYQYFIYNHPVRSSISHHRAYWYFRELNAELMNQAASYFLGEHDFTSFRGADCQSRSPMRNVQQLTITRKNKFIIVDITANAFLHHMVRNIVGALVKVGIEEKKPEWIQEVLAVRSKQVPRLTVPAHGLYLVNVDYPAEFALPGGVRPEFYEILK